MAIEAPTLPATKHMMLPGIAVAGIENVAFECNHRNLLTRRCRDAETRRQGDKETRAIISPSRHLSLVTRHSVQRPLDALRHRDPWRIAEITPCRANIVGLRTAQDRGRVACQ